MADTNTNYLTKVEMDWEEIDRKVKLHRKKQLRRLAIIAACCVAGFAALYIGSQLKTYNKYKVINSVERTDTDAARFMPVSYTHLDVYKRQSVHRLFPWSEANL